MKARKRVSGRRVPRKLSRLRASAEADEWAPTGLTARRPRFRAAKKKISLYLDADVVAWFKKDGPGYQTRINRVLWEKMKEEKAKSR
jgi:uncharacterized protein (DUF4415 family)